jgi:hypothetical protein
LLWISKKREELKIATKAPRKNKSRFACKNTRRVFDCGSLGELGALVANRLYEPDLASLHLSVKMILRVKLTIWIINNTFPILFPRYSEG